MILKAGILSACAVTVMLSGVPAFAQTDNNKQPLDVADFRALAGTGHWKSYANNTVLSPVAKGEWDAGALGSMTVLKVGEVFHMYDEAWGVRGDKSADYNSLQIDHATSRDGLHWTMDSANPVLPKGAANECDGDGTSPKLGVLMIGTNNARDSTADAIAGGVKGNNSLTLKNIIIGDIWVCSSQSNLESALNDCLGAAADIKTANLAKIRRIKIGHLQAALPQMDVLLDAPWQVCSPETAGRFTSVGFYFAREVLTISGVPIGLGDANWGATRIEKWMPAEGLDLVDELKPQVIARQEAMKAYRTQLPKALSELEAWIVKTRSELADGVAIPPMPAIPPHPDTPGNPYGEGWSTMYNAMIHPVVPLPIKGALWYQGESNGNEGATYYVKMRGLMVGKKDGRSPTVEDKQGRLKRFALAGADKTWHWAEAVIANSTVVASSPEVQEPVAGRYAYRKNPDGANLFNCDGLPASPFRTDSC